MFFLGNRAFTGGFKFSKARRLITQTASAKWVMSCGCRITPKGEHRCVKERRLGDVGGTGLDVVRGVRVDSGVDGDGNSQDIEPQLHCYSGRSLKPVDGNMEKFFVGGGKGEEGGLDGSNPDNCLVRTERATIIEFGKPLCQTSRNYLWDSSEPRWQIDNEILQHPIWDLISVFNYGRVDIDRGCHSEGVGTCITYRVALFILEFHPHFVEPEGRLREGRGR